MELLSGSTEDEPTVAFHGAKNNWLVLIAEPDTPGFNTEQKNKLIRNWGFLTKATTDQKIIVVPIDNNQAYDICSCLREVIGFYFDVPDTRQSNIIEICEHCLAEKVSDYELLYLEEFKEKFESYFQEYDIVILIGHAFARIFASELFASCLKGDKGTIEKKRNTVRNLPPGGLCGFINGYDYLRIM